MGSLKLEYYNNFEYLEKNNDYYVIDTVKKWIFFTKFNKSYLIINYPNGKIETIVDKKFIYNQQFILGNDLDFKYRFMFPLGNQNYKNNTYPNTTVPFTGILDGNNFTIKNINIIDCNNNGLFGVVYGAKIMNLTIQNVVINGGINNGSLISKANGVTLNNIKIIGNIIMKGDYCSCFISILLGTISNIQICVDGEITSFNKSLVSNKFNGSIEYLNVINDINSYITCFNLINGKIKVSNIISFSRMNYPFYITSKTHNISDSYYFQLDNLELPEMQILNNSYYKNYLVTLYSTNNTIIKTCDWISDEVNFYLKNIINYVMNNLKPMKNLYYYNIKTGYTNYSFNYINIDKKFVLSDNENNYKINKCNVIKIHEKCKKMEELYFKENNDHENINKINNKNSEIKLNILLSKMKKNHNKTNDQITYININIDNDYNNLSDDDVIQNNSPIEEQHLVSSNEVNTQIESLNNIPDEIIFETYVKVSVESPVELHVESSNEIISDIICESPVKITSEIICDLPVEVSVESPTKITSDIIC